MQLKSLSLSIITALTLIGCGGGGGSSASDYQGTDAGSTEEHKDFQQWHYFELDGGYAVNEALELVHQLMTLDKSNIYVQDDSAEIDNDYLITQDGVYQDFGPQNSKYGYLAGTGSFNNLTFIQKPYSPVGSSGLVFTTNYKKIDLGGKNALATLEARDQWKIANNPNVIFDPARQSYYNKVKNLNFPAGSSCLQDTVRTNNQEHLYAYTSNNDKASFARYEQQYAQNDPSIFKKTYKDTIAYLYSNSSSPLSTGPSQDYGAAEYKGNYYGVTRYLKGVEYSLADYIQRQKDLIDESLTEAEHKLAIEEIDTLNNQCSWYNDTAAKFIQAHMKP